MNTQPSKNFTSEEGSFDWQFLDWDSNILKQRVARINELTVKENTVNDVLAKLIESFQAEKIEYCTHRVSASNFLLIHGLERNKFRLVDGYMLLVNSDIIVSEVP